ncbi:MAG: hypothetical protein WA667_05815 [Candidatus Nitrosopolaris sp.]
MLNSANYSERKFTLILLQTFQLQKVSWVKLYAKNVVTPITRNSVLDTTKTAGIFSDIYVKTAVTDS